MLFAVFDVKSSCEINLISFLMHSSNVFASMFEMQLVIICKCALFHTITMILRTNIVSEITEDIIEHKVKCSLFYGSVQLLLQPYYNEDYTNTLVPRRVISAKESDQCQGE